MTHNAQLELELVQYTLRAHIIRFFIRAAASERHGDYHFSRWYSFIDSLDNRYPASLYR